MKNYRKLLIQAFLFIWIGMTCGYSAGDNIDDINTPRQQSKPEKELSYCTKYGAAITAVVSSAIDLGCCAGALMASEDDTKSKWLMASDTFSMITFAARMGVLHAYVKILRKELTKGYKDAIAVGIPIQNVEDSIFCKLSLGGLTTASTFFDVALAMFACESGLFSNEAQGWISIGATAAVCVFSILTWRNLCCIQINYPARSGRSSIDAGRGGARVSPAPYIGVSTADGSADPDEK